MDIAGGYCSVETARTAENAPRDSDGTNDITGADRATPGSTVCRARTDDNPADLLPLLGFERLGIWKDGMTELTDFLRKAPAQERARQTMEYIFEATAQLLDSDRADKLNTNRIAERAGFSIGTIYSYFTNKDALLRAMALRELQIYEQRFNAQIDAASGKDPAAVVRVLVRQVLAPFGARQRVRRHMLLLVGSDPAVQASVHEAIDRMTGRLLDGLGIGPDELSRERRYLLLRSALGPVRAAVLQAPLRITSLEFEDELVQLVMSLLGK
jgi:AcrR family transcriptional regulator